MKNLDKYRRNRKKVVEVTAPSGLKYKIRNMSTRTYLRIADKIGIKGMEVRVTELILEECVLYPKIGKDGIDIDELDPEDVFFLLDQIFKLSGLTEANSFRGVNTSES